MYVCMPMSDVYVCTYIDVCLHANIHICSNSDAHVYIYPYIYTQTCLSIYIPKCIHSYGTYTYMYLCGYIYTCMHIYACLKYIYVHTYTQYMPVHVCTCIYIQTYMSMHA